jgi:aspartyl-tRNA(Asn)/glutamyl-tRNA(Gln) amidotransferase subunit C
MAMDRSTSRLKRGCLWRKAEFQQTGRSRSMTVTREDVRKVARLSRIAVADDRLDALAGEINGILGWIDQLNEVDIAGVLPLTSVVAATLPMRDDVVTDGNIQAKVLANAPRSEDGFFIVPKAVE